MYGVMVRAAAHTGDGTGRTGAVRSASIMPLKRNPQLSRHFGGTAGPPIKKRPKQRRRSKELKISQNLCRRGFACCLLVPH